MKHITKRLENRMLARLSRRGKALLVLLVGIVAISIGASSNALRFVAPPAHPPTAQTTFQQYCVQCHSGTAAKAGVNLERLIAQTSVGENFQQWEKVAAVLEQDRKSVV